MLRISKSAAALLFLVACTQKPPEPPAGPLAADLAESGWLGALADDPALSALVAKETPAWAALYQGELKQALAQLGETPRDQAGRARARVQLGLWYLEVARLLAEVQLEYLTLRASLGLAPLTHGPLVEATALAFLGRPEADAALAAAAKTFSKHQTAELAALADWAACGPSLAGLRRCELAQEPLPCDATDSEASAVCGKAEAQETLLQRASEPIWVDALRDEDLVAEEAFYDPLRFWALGKLHLQQSGSNLEAVANSLKVDALMYSTWRTPADVLADWSPQAGPVEPMHVITAADQTQAAVDRVLAAGRSSAGKQALEQLKVARWLADGVYRRAGHQALAAGRCEVALELYRRALDRGSAEVLTPRNEPLFVVRALRALTCAKRGGEMVGTARALESRFPEARGLRVRLLRLVGARERVGGSGVQKSD